MTDEGISYGFVLPGGTARQQVEHAVLAEQAGWDGIFVFETAYGVDPWGLLAAMATATSRIRLGTMLTPLPWRRPWKLAAQAATVDDLSGGRTVLGVGLGAVDAALPSGGGEVIDRRRRAEMLDEGIDLLRALWAGQTSFSGTHYTFRAGAGGLAPDAGHWPGRAIPIWSVGAWPRPRSMARILRCDGVIPEYHLPGQAHPGPDDLRRLLDWLAERGRTGLDVVHEGRTCADDRDAAAAAVAVWAQAGATWWLESRWGGDQHGEARMREVRQRLEAGPPRG